MVFLKMKGSKGIQERRGEFVWEWRGRTVK